MCGYLVEEEETSLHLNEHTVNGHHPRDDDDDDDDDDKKRR